MKYLKVMPLPLPVSHFLHILGKVIAETSTDKTTVTDKTFSMHTNKSFIKLIDMYEGGSGGYEMFLSSHLKMAKVNPWPATAY